MATTKPSLSLSVSSTYAPPTSIDPPARRIASWGSATSSDTPNLRGLSEHMTPLPSPIGSREWSRTQDDHSNLSLSQSQRSIGRAASLNGHVGSRARASSIFEEMRQGSPYDVYSPEGPSNYHHQPSWGKLPATSPIEERNVISPSRSKTLDFFGGTDSASTSSTSSILSPPPNPLSRNSSLRKEYLPSSSSSSSNSPALLGQSTSSSSLVGGKGRDRASSTSSVSSWLDRSDHAATILSPAITPSARWAAKSRLSEMEKQARNSSPPNMNNRNSIDGPSGSNRSSSPTLNSSPRDKNHNQGLSQLSLNTMNDCTATVLPGGNDTDAPILKPIITAQTRSATTTDPSEDTTIFKKGDRLGDYTIESMLGKGTFSRVALGRRENQGLRALKIVAKKSYVDNERMRISVAREIEVLKHVHHPSLVSLTASFSTPLYTILVLDYCPGGELFDFLAQWHSEFFDGLIRRIFGELCAAVGWMHQIGLVHRDIKLENILLVTRPFPSSLAPNELLANLSKPFVKLTDFGLSRFIDPRSPTLTTRCGSEAYASPELIMGKPYDGRQTDSWALGIVLYSLVAGVLPFVETPGLVGEDAKRNRRAYLLKIAKGEYLWPKEAKLASEGVKQVVGKLLVRDPKRRAGIDELWNLEWMKEGEGRVERIDGYVSARDPEAKIEDWHRRGSIDPL